MIDSVNRLASFWHGGPLSGLELACLASFVRQGYEVTVYSYDKLQRLPEGVREGDARTIVDIKYLYSFMVLGKPSLAHFSDLFRYRLFEATGEAWIDADLLCLRRFEVPKTGNFFGKETASSINNAIMRVDPRDPRLKSLVNGAVAFATGKDSIYGSTGPALVTKIFGHSAVDQAQPLERFYPIHWNQWWQVFLPERYDWCVAECKNTDALHLWNSIVERAGYWKDLAPPEGSFLHRCMQDQGLLEYFIETCPASVIRRLADADVNLKTGAHYQLKELGIMTFERAISVAGKVFRRAPTEKRRAA